MMGPLMTYDGNPHLERLFSAARAAHIDVLASGAKFRCALDDGRLVAVAIQPVRQCGAGDARTGDEDACAAHFASNLDYQ